MIYIPKLGYTDINILLSGAQLDRVRDSLLCYLMLFSRICQRSLYTTVVCTYASGQLNNSYVFPVYNQPVYEAFERCETLPRGEGLKM